jgi:Protein HRI1
MAESRHGILAQNGRKMTQLKPIVNLPPVPTHYMGVWRRDLLETTKHKDASSLVLWMQTQQHHIDLRIPADRVNLRTVLSLQDYSDDELLLLSAQQGFAGVTQVVPATEQSSEVCQWLREIDFQPTTGARDIGKMVFTDANTVIETGVEDAYLEVWRRLENSQAPIFCQFTTGKNRNGLEVPAYLMRAGKYVAYARPRVVALPKVLSLNLAIQTYTPSREQLLDWLDMEISFGELLDNQHWQIKYSSLPFKVNMTVHLDSVNVSSESSEFS